ncbi:restriction endonuclease subunit S [Halomonas sp. 3H]|uniref:restriction endonuclease subunit S n=1 Tax=Halomonas sp. 3H TaxID=2952527 RepID=UPI0020B69915|nr:restriction endonuclease subunit S [Halomonas sp. 3H]
MNGDWLTVPLEEACDIEYGTRVVKKRDAGTLYPVYGGGGATFFVDQYNREDCTIVSRFGMSEECVRHIGGRFFLNDSGLSVAPKNQQKLTKRFVDHLLLANSYKIYRLGRGAAQKNLDVNLFRKILVSFPQSIEEQIRIVAILDEAFQGIDTAVANTEQNLANTREIFENYRDGIFSAQVEGWHSVELGELCSIKHGFAFKSEFFTTEGDYIVLTPGFFWEHGGFRDQGKKTKYYEGEIPDGYLLEKGEFLFAMTEQAAGLLGSSLVVPESNRYLHNQRLGLVQVKNGIEWRNDFFFHQFNTPKFRAAVQATASGAKVRHTSPKKLCAIPVVYPPSREEQISVADKLNGLWEETQRLEAIYQQKLTALAELKQSLLQKAFSGELTASKAEAAVEEATV